MTPGEAVSTARSVVAVTTAGLLGLVALSEFFDPGVEMTALAPPAGLIGIVSPVIGYRLYEWLRTRDGAVASESDNGRRFITATVMALAVTEAAAMFGVVAFVLSGRTFTLIGVMTHVTLAGAIWPSRERFDAFTGS